jgi:hypothetical protein
LSRFGGKATTASEALPLSINVSRFAVAVDGGLASLCHVADDRVRPLVFANDGK